jgi:hypothetical protein
MVQADVAAAEGKRRGDSGQTGLHILKGGILGRPRPLAALLKRIAVANAALVGDHDHRHALIPPHEPALAHVRQ